MSQADKIKWTPQLIFIVGANIVMLLIIIAALGVLGYTFFFKILNSVFV